MNTLRLLLCFVFVGSLGIAHAAAITQVGDDRVVIVNPRAEAVTISFSSDQKDWQPRSFRPHSTTEVPYARFVRIVTVKDGVPLPAYEDDISPAGKYAIVEEPSGRLVLRRPNES